MPQHWKERIHKIQSTIKQSTQAFFRLRQQLQQQLRRILTATAYWATVVVVGVGIAGVILHVSGVPLVESANATVTGVITMLIGFLFYYVIIAPIGLVAIIITFLLEIVIQYPYGFFWRDATAGGFVNVAAVQTGWKLVRDFSNMFFALILVIIALATVLKIEAYDWKRMLPKLILNAVLINFSKSIAGVFTDMATVAMATFGGSFTNTIGKAIISGFGLSGYFGMGEPQEDTEGSGAIALLASYVAAAVMIAVFAVIALVFLVTLIFRIVMLWFLIVLSPLAYVTRILPQTEKYSHQWWEMFGRYVVVGPLVTFFLWLSMTIAFDKTQKASPFSSETIDEQFSNSEALQQRGVSNPPQGAGEAATPNRLASFMVALLMLMASLKLINQMAAEAGALTGAVQKAGTGIMQSMGRKVGQMMMKAKWGVGPPAEGEKDTRTGWEKLKYNAANASAFLGGTVLQPVEAFKGFVKGIQEQSHHNQEKARGDAMIRLGAMRSEAILGRGAGGILGAINNAAGILGGAGMEDSAHIFEKYFSGEGVRRLVNRGRLWGRFGVKMFDMVEVEEEVEEEDEEGNVTKKMKKKKIPRYSVELYKMEKEEKEAKKRYTKEELETDAPVYDQLIEAIRALTGEIEGIGKGENKTIHAKTPFIKEALEMQMERLEKDRDSALSTGKINIANQRSEQMDALKNAIDSGASLSMNDVLSQFAGSDGADKLRQRITSSMQDHKKKLEKEQNEIKGRLDVTGVTDFNTNGTLNVIDQSTGKLRDGVGGTFTTEGDRKKATEDKKHAQHTRDHMLAELSAVEAGMSYEARKYKQKLVGEEMDKLRGIKNTDELMVYFNAAVDEKNHHMMEALLERITQNGDENEIFQEWLANYAHDPTVAKVMEDTGLQASSGRSGAELFRKAILQRKMGMANNESIRVMNDVCYTAEENRHNGLGRLYGTVAGSWVVRTEEEQQDTLAAENRKKDINYVIKGNRLYWGDETGPGRRFGMTESGWKELLSRGEAMGATRVWERLDANAKLNLCRPEITREMRKRNIHPDLVRKLEQYWVSTGQYIEANDWNKTMGMRRFAA